MSLAQTLAAADDARRRAAVLAACRLAAQRVQLSEPRADQALSALAEGITGDPAERAAVHELAAELDRVAWDLQDAAAGDHEYAAAFARARAASALDHAFEPDSARAASESLYEAHHAIEDLDALRAVVDDAVR